MMSDPIEQINPHKSVVVIGGGISGLCAAHWLKKRGFAVTLLEKDAEPGGTMKTVRTEGWLAEMGPNSALETSPLFAELFADLGIAGQRLYANETSKNVFIYRKGALHRLPMDPIGFLTTKLWSLGGKLRLIGEPFSPKPRANETVAQFFERKLGKEFSDYAINPFVAGIYAGKPELLSIEHVFPSLYKLEQDFGGLYMGMIRRKKPPKDKNAPVRRKSFSFIDGMQTFPNALAKSLGESFKPSCTVEHVIPMRAGKFPIYTVSYKENDVATQLQASAVIFSSPAYAIASMIRPIDPEMSRTLESIAYSPIAELFLGFNAKHVGRRLDGFGFLVPELERKNILGNLWSSAMYPHRAPEGCSALTVFIGGTRQPELTEKSNGELVDLAMADLKPILNIAGEPRFINVARWKRAIPQYAVGYGETLKAMDRFERNFQGSFLCGNFRNGVSVGDCVKNADAMAKRVEEYLKQ